MNTLRTILISFVSGLVGAFAFDQLRPQTFVQPVSNQGQLIQVKHKPQYERILETTDFVVASAAATPSVVFIKTSAMQQNSSSVLDWFFGGGGSQQVTGSGSGVIYSTDGYILTNNHVIDNATDVEVLIGKRTYKARIVGTDPSTDLAVLKIEGQHFPAIKVASSRTVQVGEWVLAVGNPFNLNSTVTAGIVSAKDRNININTSQFPIESFIQTDAAINPGNSGGALVNTKGELIGINTAILSRTGSYTGYGFAVPSDIVVKIAKDLIQYGQVQQAFLGIEVSDIDNAIVEKYGLPDYNGVLVSYVGANSAAKKAGIQKGDVILKINNESISSKSLYDEQLAYFRPGDKLIITYRRGKEVAHNQAVLTNADGTTGISKRETYTAEGLGADLESLTQVEKDRLRIDGGVRISKIRRGLMGQLGIEEGFVITAINRQVIKNPQQVTQILSQAHGRIVIEGIDRNGQESYYQYYSR